MIPPRVARRAQDIINNRIAATGTVRPLMLVWMLEQMDGVSLYTADQAAAQALASPETARGIERAKALVYYSNHPHELASALREILAVEKLRALELQQKDIGI